MTYAVSVPERGVVFPCDEGETVLDAAERAGYSIPYSCRKGVCSTCLGSLAAGEVDVRGVGRLVGPRDEVLLCQTRPASDVAIAPRRIEKREPPSRKTITASVYRLSRPTPDVAIVQLRYPAGIRMKFKAGQYLQVLLDDGTRRSFSMASAPQETDGTQLHIRRVPGGAFSETVLDGLAPGAKLAIEMPFGEFFLRDGEAPILMLATGTGFAPIKSMIEDAIKRGMKRPVCLYWGAPTAAHLYMTELPEKWIARAPWLTFTPVLSEPDAAWAGRTGFVHAAAATDLPDLSAHEVYACGNPAMVAAARDLFTGAHGLAKDRFFADSFVASGDF